MYSASVLLSRFACLLDSIRAVRAVSHESQGEEPKAYGLLGVREGQVASVAWLHRFPVADSPLGVVFERLVGNAFGKGALERSVATQK